MTVQLLDTPQRLTDIADDWNRLAENHAMRGHDWLATWHKHYQPEGELFTLGVFEAKELVGLAPWRIERSARHGVAIRWLGDGEVCTDHLTVLAKESQRQQVADDLADYLTDEFSEWDVLQLDHTDADDHSLASLSEALQARGVAVRRKEAGACWSINLPSNWDEFLATLSKSHRKQIRRTDRDAIASGEFQQHRVNTVDEWEQAWPILVDLHQRRWQVQGEPGCFASNRFTEFHREASRRLLEQGQLRLSWLEHEGQPAAAEYDLSGGKSVLAYQSGVAPELLDVSPARMLNLLAIRSAIEEGMPVYDFLRGDEPYKAHWRAEPHATVHLQAVPPRTSSQWRAAAGDLVGAVRSGLKSFRRPASS